MNLAIRYTGRAGGAFLAYKYLSGRVGGGALGQVACAALGWLAGGFVADVIAAKVDGAP